MFRALISPSSGVSQAVFYIQPFGSCGVYVAHLRGPVDWFVVVVSLYWCRGGSPVLVAEPLVQENHHDTSTVKPPLQTSPQAHADEQHKHHMNQMVVYKKQLEMPLTMGLWEPETCRVKIKEINTQNKQLHPLVTLLQHVQKMLGMNNLKKYFTYCSGTIIYCSSVWGFHHLTFSFCKPMSVWDRNFLCVSLLFRSTVPYRNLKWGFHCVCPWKKRSREKQKGQLGIARIKAGTSVVKFILYSKH